MPTLPEIRKEARDLGIPRYYKMTKSELTREIEQSKSSRGAEIKAKEIPMEQSGPQEEIFCPGNVC